MALTALTLEQIRIYEACNGDIDGWSRSRHARENPSTGDNWQVIDELLMKLTIKAEGVASKRFISALEQDIALAAPELDVRQALLALAERSSVKRVQESRQDNKP
jgi:hypothetical protein